MIPVFLNGEMGEFIGAGCCGLWFFAYIVFWFLWVACGILLFIFKIMMIIDCARKRFDNPNEQVVWILVLVLVPFGSLIYYFVVKHPDRKSPGLTPRKPYNQ